MTFAPEPATLQGRHVRLEPLAPDHGPGLLAAGADPEIWTYLPTPPYRDLADVRSWIDRALAQQRQGDEIPFATVRREDGTVVGSTRFIDIRRAHRSLEIGWTWIAPAAQRSAINTEAKFLMLQYAFGLGAVRVQLKSDERNAKSRRAMEGIGAVFEGVLRNQSIRGYDGYVRNTAMYSITDAEWPAVRARLEGRLARHGGGG